MRIFLHIGMNRCGAERIQQVMDAKRKRLADLGVLYPRTPGRKNHTRLYMAVTDPDHVDILRLNRGFASPEDQARLAKIVARDLASEIEQAKPSSVVLSAFQLSGMPRRSEIERLRALLSPLSDDIRIIAHVDEQARVLARYYAAAVLSGRTALLDQELALAGSKDWRADSLKLWHKPDPATHAFPEVQAPPHWLDYAGLVDAWEQVFGPGSVSLRPYDEARFNSTDLIEEIREAFEISGNIGKVGTAPKLTQPSAEWLSRARRVNEILIKLLEKGRVIPPPVWRNVMAEVSVDGEPIAPATLSAISKTFSAANQKLVKAHPALTTESLKPARARKAFTEPEPTGGFRATQYAAAFLSRIEAATRAEAKKNDPNAGVEPADEAEAPAPEPEKPARRARATAQLSATGEKILSDRAKENFHHLNGGRFAPHNRLGRVNEDELAAAFSEPAPRTLPAGSSGNVIVGCMKNEAPYILEWIAYHRMIGVDSFLIYTNDCTDGTDELLDRLQAMGVLQHRNNDDWKGNSPQQHALNKSLKEDLIKNAEWVIHIDVDEFINIRVGNGTLPDFFDRVPDATNVAMTWRLFGHNGVERYRDDLVIDQFTSAAPKYCPKPHTTWGFKTMTKNVGAYEKLSCHRPNKLREGFAPQVKWVNGSGQEMTPNYHLRGWRSDLKTIGYDLLQLNHYALRSAESFLVKRQRGRALHVDRSIGINYWVRMDWGGNTDVTIKRNIPRLRAELDRLMQDDELRRLHEAGVAWHKAKAAELRGMPEFDDLYRQAITTDLTELERVAFALALDMES